MRRLITLTAAFLMCAFYTVNAADWFVTIHASSFDDLNDEEMVWIQGKGFGAYAWDNAIPVANMFDNTRDSVVVHISGYAECIGDVNVMVGRLSFSAWDWKDSHKFYNDEEGSDNPALKAADFDENGNIVLTLILPSGMKQWDTYTDLEEGEFRPWCVQVTGTNSSAEHECGESYCNFVIGVSEDFVGRGSDEPSAISNVSVSNLSVYPNPVKRGEMVNVDGAGVEVFNLAGAKVFETVESSFSADELSSGMYMVKSGDKVSKLIVE